jgi:hypothetical protein
MKKSYCKPTFVKMELQPEERLAACDWPASYMPTPCTTFLLKDIPEAKDVCNLMSDPSGVS